MTEQNSPLEGEAVVAWLRQVSPYFHKHRAQTFVVYFGGEAVADAGFTNLIRDLLMLAAVGIRLVVVFGARPQIEQRLADRGITPRVVGALRVSDAQTMHEVREVVGAMRLDIEAAFSFGSRGGPLSAASCRIASGNFVLARPAGIIDGVDLLFTGLVRSVDHKAIAARLEEGEIVLLAPLGYSPTGELFNLKAKDLAATVAADIGAAKLILLTDRDGITNTNGELVRQLTVHEAQQMRETQWAELFDFEPLETGIAACELGVERVHILSRLVDGAVLRELFTRDGIGTMLSSAPFDQLREGRVEDVGGILELVQPLEDQGLLVKRSREKLENEIDHFVVMVRENTVVACGALYPYVDQGMAEIACIAVHPDYRGGQFGDMLLEALERRARHAGLRSVFVLTTQATQWFNERGFRAGAIDSLPMGKRQLYNFQRNSAVLIKALS